MSNMALEVAPFYTRVSIIVSMPIEYYLLMLRSER